MAKIHIAQKDLGLDEDTYRAMLFNLTGKILGGILHGSPACCVIAAFAQARMEGASQGAESSPGICGTAQENQRPSPLRQKAVGIRRGDRQTYVRRGLSWLDGEQTRRRDHGSGQAPAGARKRQCWRWDASRFPARYGGQARLAAVSYLVEKLGGTTIPVPLRASAISEAAIAVCAKSSAKEIRNGSLP